MNIDQYRFRDIRKYVIRCWELGKCDICEPPEGTYFAWQSIGKIKWIGLYGDGGDIHWKNKIITIAHNHTKANDIWIGPIDATRSETRNNKYIAIVRENLQNLILPNQ